MNTDFQDRHDRGGPSSGQAPKLLVAFLMLFIIAAIIYWWFDGEKASEMLPEGELAAPEQLISAPQIQHPLPDPGDGVSTADNAGAVDRIFSEPVPVLDESDSAIREALGRFAGEPDLIGLLAPQNLIRKFVVTVDNLSGKRIPQQYLPVKRLGSGFKVIEKNDVIILDPQNFARYQPYIDLLDTLDNKDIAALYVYFYPLFQESYEELGYPERFFNDRMIAAIDNLLATPQIDEPISLVQPNVFFHFADQDLEALSAGQKLLLRMGPENTSRIKHKLQEIRQLIAANN